VPYKAKHIPSNIVVFPAPVLPEITYKSLSSSSLKSIVSESLYGPKAVNVNLSGFISPHTPFSIQNRQLHVPILFQLSFDLYQMFHFLFLTVLLTLLEISFLFSL